MTAQKLLTTRTIGETENALDAVLTEILGGTGLDRLQWIAMRLVSARGESAMPARALTDQLAATQKIDDTTAAAITEDLRRRGILAAAEDVIALTATGASLHQRLSGEIQQLTERMWAGLAVADLATADRVLTTIAERANGVLAARRPASA